MAEFGRKLMMGELDRTCIRGETYCLKNDPAVGYNIWETDSREEFESKFAEWKDYYTDADVQEVITPLQAMAILSGMMKK